MNVKKTVGDNYNRIFPKRLRLLLSESNTSQTELAEAFKCRGLNVTRQTISSYANGDTTPDIDRFKFIADFFDVPYDWLLGASEARNRQNVQIGKELGLNDEAIEVLKKISHTIYENNIFFELQMRAVNIFLSDRVLSFFWAIMDYSIDKLKLDAVKEDYEPTNIPYFDTMQNAVKYSEWHMVQILHKYALSISQKIIDEINADPELLERLDRKFVFYHPDQD